MTDAALPVTQSRVETFTEQHLESLGATIEKDGPRWTVAIPDDSDTNLESGRFTLVCDEVDDVSENTMPLHPESSFFQTILEDARSGASLGKVTLDTDQTEISIPPWLQQSDIEVTNASFTPYYDRTAIVVLFQIRVETVSEYQQEFLQSIALDIRTGDRLPCLDEVVLDLTTPERAMMNSENITIEITRVKELVDTAREQVLDAIQPTIDEIHHEAARAAEAEVEEYRQMQQQREEELQERRETLQSRISELSQTIDGGDQSARVEALKKRKECKSEFGAVEDELRDLRKRRERGYPKRQQKIRDRHALDVVVAPVAVTQVDYERGDLELELTDSDSTTTLTKGYGNGVGITENIRCSRCNDLLSEENKPKSIDDGVQCSECR